MQLVDMTAKNARPEDVRNIQVRVEATLYRRVKSKMAQSDEKFQGLIVRLLDRYTAEGTSSPPELQRSPAKPKEQSGLPEPSPGVKIKGTQLTLYRELVAKVAEVIARGDSNLVAALARGIRWAHGDLRPEHPKPEEPRVEAIPPTSPKKRHGT